MKTTMKFSECLWFKSFTEFFSDGNFCYFFILFDIKCLGLFKPSYYIVAVFLLVLFLFIFHPFYFFFTSYAFPMTAEVFLFSSKLPPSLLVSVSPPLLMGVTC